MTLPLIVLAGGFGTRLKSVVSDVPKPLAPVGNRSFLEILVQNAYQSGIRKVVLSLHHQADRIEEAVCDWTSRRLFPELEFLCAAEPEPLGTGGAVKWILSNHALGERILVCNGDTYLPAGLETLHQATQKDALLGLVRVEDARRYGTVSLSSHGYVESFVEKSPSEKPGWIYGGICRIDSESILCETQSRFSLEGEVFPKLAAQNKLRGIPVPGSFIDIGIPEDYASFCQRMLDEQ